VKFFIDQCVPDSAGRALKAAGHEVVFLRERIAPNSPDPLVAAVAEANGAILVSLDSDFKGLANRAGIGQKRFRTLSRLCLRCRESRAAVRIQEAMTLIEHEWDHCQRSSDRRLFIELGDSYIRTVR
jgi:predicted nuclease of predicted toxin-antitoxin system